MRWTKLARSLALALLLLTGSCSRQLNRTRQVRTVADMQTIVAKIEALRGRSPVALGDAATVRRLIASVASGRDAWGNEFQYSARSRS